MAVYLVLVLLPAVLNGVLVKLRAERIKEKVVFCFFYLLLIILSFRSMTVGIDLPVYSGQFSVIAQMDFKGLYYYGSFELGYALYCKLVSCIANNFNVFLVITAFLCILPLVLFYGFEENNKKPLYKESEENVGFIPFLTVCLFAVTSNFVMLFSGLRQAMATSICVIAYKFMKEKKPLHFFLTVSLAFFFHMTSIIFLVAYPIYHFKVNHKHLMVILPLMLLIFIFKEKIFLLPKSFLGKYSKYLTIEETGAWKMTVLLMCFAIYCYVLPDENKLDDDTKGLRSLLLLCIVMHFFSSINFIVSRITYYFTIFLPILIPKVAACPKEKFKTLSKLSVYLMSAFFALYFFYGAYFGGDALHVYPYVPFWSK